MRQTSSILLCVAIGASLAPLRQVKADPPQTYDLIVYGGTSGGVAAAIQAARMGKSVAIIEPTQRLGGMTTNGLSATDTGNTNAIQGLAREFYVRVGQAYGLAGPEWKFEPHVAENTLEGMVLEANVVVYRGERLDLTGGVVKSGAAITSIRTESGKQFNAAVFVDASYEGDLLAEAGVAYTVGRESNLTYGETYNGVQTARAVSHQFTKPVDPYVVPGVPSSGLLPGVSSGPPGVDGQADSRVQAYNYRLIVTKDPNIRLPWTAPSNYDPNRYELLRRHIQATNPANVGAMLSLVAIRNGKYDMNNKGAVSTDNIGANYAYPDGNYVTREQIIQDHRDYQQGLLYFLATDPGVPPAVRNDMNGYGLCRDEFADSNGWSGQLYVREGRRMVGAYVMTDRHVQGFREASDPVALASYTMDSHNTQRYVDANGCARNEGDVQIGVKAPYGVSYRSLTPLESQASNLLVTSAISASHIAYGSIRMEPVFLELGQAAGTAAALAIDGGTSVQDVSYAALSQRLIADGALLWWPNNVGPFVGVTSAEFNDQNSLPANMRYTTGGTNLAGSWDGTNTEDIVAGDLATARGGYCIVQSGSGKPGKVRGDYDVVRQNYRDLSGRMSGVIWFSFLLENPDGTASSGVSFNPTGNGDPNTDTILNFVELDGDNLEVTLGGMKTDANIATLATGVTHLIVGRITIGDGDDTFELWADPNDLASLGGADFTTTDKDFMGSLTGIGVLSYNSAGPPFSALGGFVDAVLLSNRPGVAALQDVTGIPEPGAILMLAGGALGVIVRRRRV